MSEFTKHPGVTVRVGDVKADIDVKIAPLIHLLWEAKIDTQMSCQEDGSARVWIQFASAGDLTEFLNAVTRYEPGAESLYNRITGQWDAVDEEKVWRYDVHPEDLNVTWIEDDKGETVEEHHSGEVAFLTPCSVRFPPEDLPVVVKRMEEYVAKKDVAVAEEKCRICHGELFPCEENLSDVCQICAADNVLPCMLVKSMMEDAYFCDGTDPCEAALRAVANVHNAFWKAMEEYLKESK